MNEHHANHPQNVERWRGRIQNELIEMCTGSMSIASHDNGHDFHYRHHRVNLDSGTCYIWFAIHTSTANEKNDDDDVVVLVDASTETVVTRTVRVKGQTEEIVESLALYPNRPPRVQYISGALPPGSTITKGEFMEWKWFRGGQELEAHKWSPGLRIPDAVELLSKSLIQDYCQCQRSFPPPSQGNNLLSQQSSWAAAICYFVCGCFSTAQRPALSAPRSKSAKDQEKAQKLLNQLDVPEPGEGGNHDTASSRQLDNAQTSSALANNTTQNVKVPTKVGTAPASAATMAATTPDRVEPALQDVDQFRDSAVADSLRCKDHQQDAGAADEEEKQEIDEIANH